MEKENEDITLFVKAEGKLAMITFSMQGGSRR